jgi:hypothetical protein
MHTHIIVIMSDFLEFRTHACNDNTLYGKKALTTQIKALSFILGAIGAIHLL